jgi:flagellar basal body-associated protein FliL
MVHAPKHGMSEAAAEKTAKAPAAAGGNKLLVIVIIVFNVMIAGGLAFVVLNQQHAAAAAASAAISKGKHGEGEDGEGEGAAEAEGDKKEGGEEKAGGAKGAHGKFGPLLEVGSFVANLQGPGAGRYAKVTLHVEATNEEALMFLSNAKPEDVIGQDKIRALSEEMIKRINVLLGGKKAIKQVYFSELVVQ